MRRSLLAAALLLSMGACQPQKVGIQMGEKVPDVRLQSIDGKNVDLASFRGKPILIDFWATWCGPCRESLPAVQGLHEMYGPKGLVVLAVTADDTPEEIRAFAKKLNLKLPWYRDPIGVVSSKLGVTGLPTTIVIDKAGNIVFRESGVSGDTALRLNKLVQELL